MTVSLFVTEECFAKVVGFGVDAEMDLQQAKSPTIEVHCRNGGYGWLYLESPQHLREFAAKLSGYADKCDTILKGQQ